MANENKDVLRLEGVAGASGVVAIMRAKQIGFELDSSCRMIHKEADGTLRYWSPDGIATVAAGDVTYSEAGYPLVTDVEAGLNQALRGGYRTNLGPTGIPYYGDGVVPLNTFQQGMAIYSTDGHVYFMGEAGFTGLPSVIGCKFLINPVASGDRLAFVHGGGTSYLEYSSIGFTGAGGSDAELSVVASGKTGYTAHLLLQASYGKIKLQTSTVGSGNDGIVLIGDDDAGVSYSAAATGKFRQLYADADGELVVASNDQDAKYLAGGFTGLFGRGANFVGGACTYVLDGSRVWLTIPDIQIDSADSYLGMTGLVSAIRTTAVRSGTCLGTDIVLAPTNWTIGAAFTIGPSSTNITFMAQKLNAFSGEPEYGTTYWSTTGVIGLPAQTIQYTL